MGAKFLKNHKGKGSGDISAHRKIVLFHGLIKGFAVKILQGGKGQGIQRKRLMGWKIMGHIGTRNDEDPSVLRLIATEGAGKGAGKPLQKIQGEMLEGKDRDVDPGVLAVKEGNDHLTGMLPGMGEGIGTEVRDDRFKGLLKKGIQGRRDPHLKTGELPYPLGMEADPFPPAGMIGGQDQGGIGNFHRSKDLAGKLPAVDVARMRGEDTEDRGLGFYLRKGDPPPQRSFFRGIKGSRNRRSPAEKTSRRMYRSFHREG
jgi:hypothetical protein